jgi:5-methylcytosine-specific restriction protein A
MSAYLMVWNPKSWDWKNLKTEIQQVKAGGICETYWSCGVTKRIKSGDRLFLVKVGTQPKGIIASGYATSDVEDDNGTLRVHADFDILLDPDKDEILGMDILTKGRLSVQNWTPQASGPSIKDEIIEELEEKWFQLNYKKISTKSKATIKPDSGKSEYSEGLGAQVMITRYERNPYARKKCVEKFGYSCCVCNFNFEKVYGETGKNFIHVHHLEPISTKGKSYNVNPESDLRPVCANCHAIIHRRRLPYSIDEVKSFLSSIKS